MQIKESTHNACYYPSDVGDGSVLNIFCTGFTHATPDYYVDITDVSDSTMGFYNLEYVTDGICYIDISGKTYTVEKGDFFLINKNLPRILYTSKTDPVRKYFISAKGSLLDGIVKGYNMTDPIIIIKSNVADFFLKIFGILGSVEIYTIDELGEIASEILHILHRAYTDSPSNDKNAKIESYSAEDIAKFIDMNVGRKFTFEEMCDFFYISRSTLWRIFRNTFKITPLEYLQMKRMEKAKYYLLNTTQPISALHEAIGLDDPKYFSVLFKKETGMTPLKFRKTYFGMQNMSPQVLRDAKKSLSTRKTPEKFPTQFSSQP